ncbi:MAG: carbohydrate porin [Mariprofundaceae bacterium]
MHDGVLQVNPIIRLYLTTVFMLCFLPLSLAAAEMPGFLSQTSSAEKEAKIHGHKQGILSWPGITGEWGGLRSASEAAGLTLATVYTGEFVRNFDAGLVNGRKETIYHDDLDLTATLDTEKAGLWPGGTLFVYGLFNHGGFPSVDVIGDVQTASNIEASRNQFIVQEAWYQQTWMAGKASVLVGLYDLNSEFYVSDYASLFINSSPGIGAEISGNVPTSLFPKAGLAVRTRIEPADGFYLQVAALDGNPETRSISNTEGTMFIGEGGYAHNKGSYKAGYWMHTADKTFAGQTFKDDYGVYGIIDQELIAFADDAAIAAFLQWGWVPHKRNEITKYFGSGLHMHGLIPGRGEDDLGVAAARAYTHVATETALELTYRLVIAPWLAVQPSFQWIINPGGDNTASAIKVGLLRFEVTL